MGKRRAGTEEGRLGWQGGQGRGMGRTDSVGGVFDALVLCDASHCQSRK
jgi:hypothetical protein